LSYEFPSIIPLTRPLLELSDEPLNNHWIAGFTAAEGSFSLTINENDNRKIPQVRARLSIGTHARDQHILMIMIIMDHFNAGNLYYNNQGTFVFEIANLKGINTKIIPLFDEHGLNNIKNLDYLDFKKIIYLIDNGEHLTESGLITIREIKSKMNLRRT
jgi:hypothetical protein